MARISRPRTAPTNQGEARAAVDQTWLKLKVCCEAAAEGAVEDAEDDRHLGPARAELVADREPGLQVDEVVAGQDRHRARLRQVDRAQRLSQGRVAVDDRRAEAAGVLDVAVRLVALDHDHVAPLRPQPLQHPQPDRAEADQDDVALHPPGCSPGRATARSAG